ncbi:nuclear transport factor 2 family protein [Amycolatopsis taiwanensis]|uniref:nuclear transport factor 2 family protein n=1 Tax=Amycolatopsis taiwanensis TaxID=342230 RepID=UPI000480C854|nr:nuclear transport factor 2 family protein [Amycolatopsis taiwanensis]
MRLSAADRIELTDLVSRYAAYVDERSPEAPELFCTDAVLVMPSPPGRLDPVDVHTGRSEIGAALAALDDFPLTRHAITGSVFDPGTHPGTATGRVACIAHHLRERAPGEVGNIVWHLHYADRYVETRAGWLFSRREVHIDWIETGKPRRWRIETETR